MCVLYRCRGIEKSYNTRVSVSTKYRDVVHETACCSNSHSEILRLNREVPTVGGALHFTYPTAPVSIPLLSSYIMYTTVTNFKTRLLFKSDIVLQTAHLDKLSHTDYL